MRRILTLSITFVAAVAMATSSYAALLTGVTANNQYITFDSSAPNVLLTSKAITGLVSNESIRGIDYRPTNGLLYALGQFGNVYTIDPSLPGPAVATWLFDVNTDPDLIADGGLSGTNFGFDFNPSADASGANSLRIVSNNGQNLAVNASTGDVFVATDVAYGGGSPSPNIVGEAYTNSAVGGSTIGTTQYAIDSGTDGLVLQAFNAGTLTHVGSVGFNTTADVGFEIIALNNGNNLAFATFDWTTTNDSNLVQINLSTGAATDLGMIDGGLLVPNLTANPTLIQNQVPEPTTGLLSLVLTCGLLVRRR